PVLQIGTFGTRDVLAWTLASAQGYTMEGLPWSPRLGLQADVASGDTEARGGGNFGTFNPLFFKAGYFNDASLIRPSNIMDVHPTVQVHPGRSVLLTVGSDILWRYTTKDGIYGPGGNLELPAGGGPRYVATSADVSAHCGDSRPNTSACRSRLRRPQPLPSSDSLLASDGRCARSRCTI